MGNEIKVSGVVKNFIQHAPYHDAVVGNADGCAGGDGDAGIAGGGDGCSGQKHYRLPYFLY